MFDSTRVFLFFTAAQRGTCVPAIRHARHNLGHDEYFR